MKLDPQEKLVIMKEAQELMQKITHNDIRMDIRWLHFLRHANSSISIAIKQYKKDLIKQTEKKVKLDSL